MTGFALYKFSLLLLPLLLLLLSSKNGTAQTRFPDSCRCVPSSFFDSCLRSFTCPPFLQDDYDHGHQCQVFYLCPFHLLVTAVARKRPRSFCQNCRWQVTPKHTNTLDPTKSELANYTAVPAQCGNLSGNELTRNSSGNTRLQSSQLAEPLWTDPGLRVELVCTN